MDKMKVYQVEFHRDGRRFLSFGMEANNLIEAIKQIPEIVAEYNPDVMFENSDMGIYEDKSSKPMEIIS